MPSYDDLGHPLELPHAPRRVISLVPSLTEAVADSAPGVLIGATDWCTHPSDLDVRRFGGTKNPQVAAIVAATPDLVIANEEENKREHVEALRAAGMQVWVTAISDVASALASLGRLLDVLEAPERGWYDAARVAWADPPQVKALAHLTTAPDRPAGQDQPERRDHPERARVRALVPIWRKPWMALGAGTYAGDVRARLGVDNVLAHHAERYPRIDPGQVARDSPYELVVLPDEPYRFTDTDGPEAFSVPAALVDGRALTWYGPAMVEAPHILAAVLAAPIARGAPG